MDFQDFRVEIHTRILRRAREGNRVWLSPVQYARMNFERSLQQTISADYTKFETAKAFAEPTDRRDWFQFQVEERLESGRNIWGGVTGDLGSGKTYWAMRVAEEFDPSFSVDRVVFSSKDFIETVQKLSAMSWVIYDEPGVTMSNRAWM